MNKKFVLDVLRDVRRAATMGNMAVNNICAPGKSTPTFADGRRVTEANVTEFIVERTRIYRETWIIGHLDVAIAEIEAST